MRIEYLDTHDERSDELLLGLRQWNKDRGFEAKPSKFSVMAFEGDVLKGGARGIIEFNWMFIQTMYVKERLNGLGTRILKEVETHARAQGITGISLLTVDKQAPGFYQKTGFKNFATIPDFIDGQTRYYFMKRLDGK